jgi:hypothetical protein
MKVFISSVIKGYESYRDAAANAIGMLGHTVIRAEEFPAAPDAPQQVCLRGVREADLVLLLMGERYGYVAPSGMSATHEEYRETRERVPVLVFIEAGLPREVEQQKFVSEVQSYVSGHYTNNFTSAKDLQAAVVKGLHQYELSVTNGPVDEAEMLKRAKSLIPADRSAGGPIISVVVVGGPRQQVLRPAEIEDSKLSKKIMQQAMFGEHPIFLTDFGNKASVDDNSITLEQNGRNASIRLDELGTVRIMIPARDSDRRDPMSSMTLIEEDIQQKISQMIQFSGWILDQIDPLRRLTDVVVVAGLTGAGYLGWLTRNEMPSSGGSVTMGRGSAQISVNLSPPRRNRAALIMVQNELAEDLTTLLRRKVRS